ncbi:hypothetical protein VTN02DRAFT_1653 [Thermoascus thermophilus]
MPLHPLNPLNPLNPDNPPLNLPVPPTAAILSTAFLGLGALHFLAPLQMCKIFGLPCSSIEKPPPPPPRPPRPTDDSETSKEPAVPTTATVELPPEGVEGRDQCRDCRCRCRCPSGRDPEPEPEPAPLAFIYANGGREVMLAIAFVGMGVMGDRRGMGALMVGIAVAAQIDAYVVWKYGGEKYGGWKGRWPMHSIGGLLVGLAAWRGWGL